MIRLDDDDEPGSPDVPEPMGPERKEPGDNRTLSSPINELESRLLKQRKVLIFGAINDKVARDVTGRLLSLASEGSGPIDVFINSAGRPRGKRRHHPRHDPLRERRGPGQHHRHRLGGASAGALIFLAGKKECRVCLPQHPLPAAPADGRSARPGDRHRYRGARDHQDARTDQPHHRV